MPDSWAYLLGLLPKSALLKTDSIEPERPRSLMDVMGLHQTQAEFLRYRGNLEPRVRPTPLCTARWPSSSLAPRSPRF